MMKCYFHYSIDEAQDFQEHLESLIQSPAIYLADEIRLSTVVPDSTVIKYNKKHHDRRIDEKFQIILLVPYGGEVQIVNRTYIRIDNCQLNVQQMNFVLKLVDELREFEGTLDYRPEKEV